MSVEFYLQEKVSIQNEHGFVAHLEVPLYRVVSSDGRIISPFFQSAEEAKRWPIPNFGPLVCEVQVRAPKPERYSLSPIPRELRSTWAKYQKPKKQTTRIPFDSDRFLDFASDPSSWKLSDERCRKALIYRFGYKDEPHTYAKVAKRIGLGSRENARRIINKGLRQLLRQFMRDMVIET